MLHPSEALERRHQLEIHACESQRSLKVKFIKNSTRILNPSEALERRTHQEILAKDADWKPNEALER